MLVVDDEPMVADMTKVFFHGQYEVELASDGQAGLEAFNRGAFEVVMTDVVMPRMDGIRLVQAIRNQGSDVPILIISAYPFSREEFGKLSKSGATSFLPKPFTAESMSHAVAEVIKLRLERGRQSPGLMEVPGQGPVSQVADSVLIETSAAFIHKLNSELASLDAISGILEDLVSKASPDIGKMTHLTTQLRTVVRSASYVLQRFRNTLGRHPGSLRVLDIHSILYDIQHHLAPGFPCGLKLDLAQGPLEVMGDHELLWHLFENLIRNGLEAIQGRADGMVTVSTSTSLKDNSAQIIVKDNGSGISPELLPRIFDLNCSTKPGGMGIGLYVVRRAATLHGGRVECSSETGAGSEFTVFLPLKPERKSNP
jgi:signal transduction histidine kinase